ncbi:pyruvate dehydrogenase complex dihydrolipoamide acetyltransferase [Microvirga sp. W0021]|uniref:Acetyltransferase component of pyruvate dehydrogenase complex n=1 Tax=Hohaiivirga grylli TaxID=3133970 RepID=A0ABV0BMR6_9HYPH
MSINILMPALSPTMEKGNLAKWVKKEGDKVSPGDVIAEIETDKATMEVEAIDEGVLAKILVPEGTADVPVNQLIAVMAEDGEDAKAVAASAGQGGNSAPAAAPAPAASPAPAAPSAPAPTMHTPASPISANTGKIFASPLAKRIAKMNGIDLTNVKGTGPRGRIVERDVRAILSGDAPKAASSAPAAQSAAAPAQQTLATSASSDSVKALYEAGSYEEISLDGMRKTVAKRLVESKQTVPHFYLSIDIELDQLMALRGQVNSSAPKDADGKPAFKLSVNDFVIKALALGLQRVPAANAVWADDRILKFKHSDVGVAVAIEGGLFTPVVRKAETKTLSAISNEMKDMAARARTRKLRPEEYQGGSTAVSNLGMFGIKNFSAVINPPHATILAVGAGEERVVVKNCQPTVVQAMTVTLSCDHRVVDGAVGAELLSAIKGLIENPMTMLA